MATEAVADDYLDRPLRALFDDVAGTDSVPAAGSVIATLGALSAGLAAKVAHRSHSRLPDAEEIAGRLDALRLTFEPLITADALGYAAALAVRGDDRAAAMHALSFDLVLIAEAAATVAELASTLALTGNPNLRYDAEASVRIAVTVTQIAAELIGANVVETELSRRANSAAGGALAAAIHCASTSGSRDR
ncbi:MAG: cyclodeaminase/cyclohydrolase family protein [Terrimesophilobacter sp.]